LLYLVTLTTKLGNCYDITAFLQQKEIFEDLPPEFSKKIVYSLELRFRTEDNFILRFGDALAAIGNHMVVLGSPKRQLISRNLNAHIISLADLSDVEKVMTLLCQEQESTMQDEIKTCKVTCGNFPTVGVRDNKVENRIEMHLSDENICFWEKFESFQVFMHVQKDARIIIIFLKSVLSWLEQRGPPVDIDSQLFEEVKHICNQFEDQSIWKKRANLTVEDLCSMWNDGEKKLQKVISFLRSEKASRKESDRRKEVAPAVQFHTDGDDEWSGCSDNEPDTGGEGMVEPAKEEATVTCSTSKKKAQKKNKKKSKKSKRGKK